VAPGAIDACPGFEVQRPLEAHYQAFDISSRTLTPGRYTTSPYIPMILQRSLSMRRTLLERTQTERACAGRGPTTSAATFT
jgi:hypothetical protein